MNNQNNPEREKKGQNIKNHLKFTKPEKELEKNN